MQTASSDENPGTSHQLDVVARNLSKLPKSVERLNWSSTLEDLLDDGKTHEAQLFLEGLVAELQSREDASSNLTLASALSDLASLYHTLGLSLKAQSASSSALLIKETAQSVTSVRSSAIIDSTKNRKAAETCTVSHDEAQEFRKDGSGSDCEEEWESLLSEGSIKLGKLSLARNVSGASFHETKTYKQRGRGAFTHGEMGMHIDRMEVSSTEGRNQSDTQEEEFEGVSSARTKLNYGVRHVLILSFSPSVTTKDLEDLFEPFVAANGVAIRWVNDTTALAIFRNPETAKEALKNTKNPSFKIEQLADDEPLLGLINEKDLQPPVPRPATTSQAAHRMIMGALQRQGLQKKTSSTLKSSQQQESERKQRILTRQRLRDEAWGSEV